MATYDPFATASGATITVGSGSDRKESAKRTRMGEGERESVKKSADGVPVHPESPTANARVLGRFPILDDRTSAVIDLVLGTMSSDKVEIEAKLGTLLFKDSSRGRVGRGLPIGTEALWSNTRESRFESSISEPAFRRINQFLNDAYGRNKSEMRYVHDFHTDVKYDSGVREVRDPETRELKFVESKSRSGDVDFVCPRRTLDYRVSSSVESPLSLDYTRGRRPRSERQKDRRSYCTDSLSIDLTRVETWNHLDPSTLQRQGPPTVSFEVEIEILGKQVNLMDAVHQYRKSMQDRTSLSTTRLAHLVHTLLQHIRLLQDIAGRE